MHGNYLTERQFGTSFQGIHPHIPNIFDNFWESLLRLLLAVDATEGKSLAREEGDDSGPLVLPSCFVGEQIQQLHTWKREHSG